jgi:hypothetical protein
MKQNLLLACGLICLIATSKAAPSLQDEYIRASIFISKGDKLDEVGRYSLANENYKEALEIILKIQKTSNEYEPTIIKYRIKYLNEKVSSNKDKKDRHYQVDNNSNYQYKINNASVIITNYTGNYNSVKPPSIINGMPVTELNRAFEGCFWITEVEIPNSVTNITYAFSGCYGLTNISIPNGVTSIGDGALSYCKSLTRLNLPKSIENIGHCALNGCSGLTSLTVLMLTLTQGNYFFF